MTKRALSAVTGFLSLCLTLSAQQAFRPDGFSALNYSLLRLPSLNLSDGGPFSFSGAAAPSFLFNWMEPTSDFLPALNMASMTARSQRANASAVSPTDSSKDVVDVQRSNLFDYAGGEAGFLYGRSSGKFGRDVEAGYIFGEVGNDKFHISVGAAYENLSERFPRLGH